MIQTTTVDIFCTLNMYWGNDVAEGSKVGEFNLQPTVKATTKPDHCSCLVLELEKETLLLRLILSRGRASSG